MRFRRKDRASRTWLRRAASHWPGSCGTRSRCRLLTRRSLVEPRRTPSAAPWRPAVATPAQSRRRSCGGDRARARPACVYWCCRAPALSLLGLRRHLHRKRELEHRAFADLGLDPELAAVHLDDAAGNGKSEAGATLLFCGGVVGLLEFLENLALVGLGDARASVLHRDRERAVGRGRLDHDAALVGELDGVADQVENHLGQPAFV